MRNLGWIIGLAGLLVGPVVANAQAPANISKNTVHTTIAQVEIANTTVAAVPYALLVRPEVRDGSGEVVPCGSLVGICDELYNSTSQVQTQDGTTVAVTEGFYFVPGASSFSRGGKLFSFGTQILQDGQIVAASPGWIFSNPITRILGNVFATGGAALQGVDLGNRGVAAGGAGIAGLNALAAFPNYQIDSGAAMYWNPVDPNKNSAMTNVITRIAQSAKPFAQTTISGNFNLNPTADNPTPSNLITDKSNPDGQVWLYQPAGDEDLVINNANFIGKGTLVVKNHDVKITGNVKTENFDPSQLGVMVLDGGGLIFQPGASRLRGVIFVPGTYGADDNRANGGTDGLVRIDGGAGATQLEIVGSIVADDFELSQRSADASGYGVVIRYDQRVYQAPPPGFASLLITPAQESKP